MNIYLLKQQDRTLDCFDSIVVAASSEYEAKTIHPRHPTTIWQPCPGFWCQPPNDHIPEEDFKVCWADSPESVEVEFLGVAKTADAGVLHKSWINE